MRSPGRALLALAALAACILAAMAAVGPAHTLDKLFWYTAEDATALLSGLGPDGQARYLRNELLDLAFIAVYSAFAFLAAGPLWGSRLSPRALRAVRGLVLLPGLLDLVETTLVISALTGAPEALPAKVRWLCAATPAKWSAAAVLLVCALAGAANMIIFRDAPREA